MRINKSFYSGLLTFFTFFILSTYCNATVSTPSLYQLNTILSDSPEEAWIYDKGSQYTTPGTEFFVLDDYKTRPDISEAVFVLHKSPIKVINITSTEAKNIAEEIINNLLPNVQIFLNGDYITLSFRYWSRNLGRMVIGDIEPILIQNSHKDKQSGIVYKFSTFPLDYKIPVKFFKELDKDIKAHRLTTAIYEQYKVHKDKGMVDMVAASIPTSYAGFKKFLDDKDESRLFEGIWTTLDSAETLGIVYVKNDSKFKYHAFIIKSDHLHWKPGEIKIKFFRLREGKLAASEYYAESKAQVGLTWKVERELLTMLNAPDRKNIILVKSYPTEDTDFMSGVGTGWAISEDGIFVTNYHVIEFANKIYIGTNSQHPALAKVLAVDKRNDLAIIKVLDKKEIFKPIPISTQGNIRNGEDIVAIGYPLAFKNMLGDDPRITNGIISAQSGFRKDVTRYQISATIQPGNSGGPVIDSHGKAVGVVVSSLVHGQSVNFAIKSSYLLTLIKQAGIKMPTITDNLKMNPPSIFSTYKESVLPVWTED